MRSQTVHKYKMLFTWCDCSSPLDWAIIIVHDKSRNFVIEIIVQKVGDWRDVVPKIQCCSVLPEWNSHRATSLCFTRGCVSPESLTGGSVTSVAAIVPALGQCNKSPTPLEICGEMNEGMFATCVYPLYETREKKIFPLPYWEEE